MVRPPTIGEVYFNSLNYLGAIKKWHSEVPLLISLYLFGSSVSMEEPDYSSYTRARYMKEYSERVVLNCGDVLFIPEGWYTSIFCHWLHLYSLMLQIWVFGISFCNTELFLFLGKNIQPPLICICRVWSEISFTILFYICLNLECSDVVWDVFPS